MNSIEIPTLLFWENGNSWYGSLGNARIILKPETLEGQGSQLSAQLWRGPLAMDQSEIIAAAAFTVSEEGLDQATAWLVGKASHLIT